MGRVPLGDRVDEIAADLGMIGGRAASARGKYPGGVSAGNIRGNCAAVVWVFPSLAAVVLGA